MWAEHFAATPTCVRLVGKVEECVHRVKARRLIQQPVVVPRLDSWQKAIEERVICPPRLHSTHRDHAAVRKQKFGTQG